MGKMYHVAALFLCLAMVSCSKSSNSIEPEKETPKEVTQQQITFTKESGTFAGTALPYRKALINSGKEGKNILVLYLHGGSAKGSDNEKQIAEPGVTSVSEYLKNAGAKAVMIVPQCPSSGNWDGVSIQPAVKALVDNVAAGSNVNFSKIFVLGGSMGGTGTWALVNTYPTLFAAAMPCAGNPSKCKTSNVVKTPVYAVMGTADNIMSVETVQTFIAELDKLGGKTRLDVITGWTHEQTCKQSYTSTRLQWLFSQSR
ncbi:MAG: dienelactone hydrolase family protein [Bacteroidales bacterium]|nr:dienelactone hydrolase family protein [Bacteroidales bacterium]